MLSRVAERMSRLGDKSAPAEYCTNEGERDLSVSSDRRADSVPSSEPESHPSADQTSNDTKSFITRIPSRILSFCGGGHLCISHLGVLRALRDRGLLKHIRGVVGISGGALVGLTYILGYTLEEIERLLYSIDLSIFTNIESDSALLFYETLCINSGQMLEKFLTSLLEAKGYTATTTFAELRRRPFFRCYATRLQSSDIQEFSIAQTPNHPVLFAVRASMCLPIVFAPMKDPFTDTLYYDAALIHNLPFAFLTEEEKRHALCIFFDVASEGIEYEFTSVFKYALKSFFNARNVHYLRVYGDSFVTVKVNPLQLLDGAKADLIANGHSAMLSFLDSPSKKRLLRRYSVC
jgi:predicted acylesterase/phospholipase RssA